MTGRAAGVVEEGVGHLLKWCCWRWIEKLGRMAKLATHRQESIDTRSFRRLDHRNPALWFSGSPNFNRSQPFKRACKSVAEWSPMANMVLQGPGHPRHYKEQPNEFRDRIMICRTTSPRIKTETWLQDRLDSVLRLPSPPRASSFLAMRHRCRPYSGSIGGLGGGRP
jgi:hypothetical protein